MNSVRYSVIGLACLTLTSLSIATGGGAKIRAGEPGSADPTKGAAAGQAAPGKSATGKGVRTNHTTGLGPGAPNFAALGLGETGSPNMTADVVRGLKVGDHLSLPTPNGTGLDYVVSKRSWTAADEQQVHLRSGPTGASIYGVISQVGPRLTGYFLARDGNAYALSPTDAGCYRLTLRPNYGELECGVGRVRAANPHAAEFPVGEGGIAGAVTPCPPEVVPFEIPPGLQKDSGILIDVMFVFSVDANDAIVAAGSTAYDQAVLTVAQVNTALENSAGQGATSFDGQDGNNPLNQNCGYGGPYPTMTGGPWSCGPVGEPNASSHDAKAGVTPAETDVCTPRIRLVAALVCDGFFGVEEPFVSTGQGIDLDRVENPNDGILDYVPLWRDALGADEVALVGMDYGSDSAFVGLASLMNDANNGAQAAGQLSIPGNPHPIVDETAGAAAPSNVSTLRAFSEAAFCLLDQTILGDLVYAHELGHNLGCQHNHEAPSAQPQDALFPDSFGFGEEEYRSVMAYPMGANVRLPGFSNPDKRWSDYGAPLDVVDIAGKEYDFECGAMDDTGTGTDYVPQSGNGPGICDQESDDPPNDASAMVVATDTFINDSFKDCANNSRSISQVKYDFARFRCSIFPVSDCNNNQIDDFVESLDGTNADCDGNGIPDECETAVEDPGIPSPVDCNQNEVPDSCDIAQGTSQDINSNGLPDECEDATLLFRESFENIPYGTHDGELPICKIAAVPLAQLREVDPDFPEYFATVESTDYSPDPNDTGFIYTDIVPGLFQYSLGRNGNMNLYGVLGQGYAMAFGSRGYGQRLTFNATTGEFPSVNGVTTFRLAREATEARFYMNAADFQDYFAEDPPLPLLPNHPYLEENVVLVQAIQVDPATGAETVVFTRTFDLRNVETPGVSSGFQFVLIRSEAGAAEPIHFEKIVITGAFCVFDNVSFDMGQVFPDCPADIAGGDPAGGLPTPDGIIGAQDLVLILALFGADPADALFPYADINEDGFVDGIDLLEVISQWGTCPGSGVPGN